MADRLALRFAGALAGVMLVCGGCTGDDDGPHDCEAVESASYPDLEEGAEETLRGVEYSLSRFSRCEDQGVPGASVIAAVPDWTSRKQAEDHLTTLGWRRDQSLVSGFDSTDGDITASVVMEGSDQGTQALVYFSESDESR